jgi:hypothetical protein
MYKKDNGYSQIRYPRIRTRKTQAFQEGGTVAVQKLTTGETILMSLCYYNKRLQLLQDSRVR